MRFKLFNQNRTRSKFILLDTKKCIACWKCIKVCSNNVISKIDLAWHKHALLVEPNNCIGCNKCIDICQNKAYSSLKNLETNINALNQKKYNSLIINTFLLIIGLIMTFSGLLLQVGYHVGSSKPKHEIIQSNEKKHHSIREMDTSKRIISYNYYEWSLIHKTTIVIFSLLIILHIYYHWNWYKLLFKKKLYKNNRQKIIFYILFLFVAITGLIPWIIDLTTKQSEIRVLFIEIHDKIAIIFSGYLLIHVIKRIKWYPKTYKTIKNT